MEPSPKVYKFSYVYKQNRVNFKSASGGLVIQRAVQAISPCWVGWVGFWAFLAH